MKVQELIKNLQVVDSQACPINKIRIDINETDQDLVLCGEED